MTASLFKHRNACILVWVMVVFSALVIYFIWALDRGFEISDESYYVLLAMYPLEVKLFNSAQHWITAPLWQATGSLCLFRAIGLGILLLTSAMLARGALHAYSSCQIGDNLKRGEKACVYACCAAGALLYGVTINFSPCYNLLAAATAYAAAGVVLLVIGRPATAVVCGGLMVAGCVIGIAILNKFPAGFATAGVLMTFIAVFGRTNRRKILGIVYLCVGILISFAGLVSYHMMSGNVFDQFQLGSLVFKTVQTESGAARLLRYVDEFSRQAFWSGAWVAILIACLEKQTTRPKLRQCRKHAMLAVVLLNCVHLPAAFGIGRWVGVTALLAALMAVCLLATLDTWTRNLGAVTLTIGLVLLPYCVAFGTGNPINTQIVVALAPWGAVVAMLAIVGNASGRGNWLGMVSCAIFPAVIAVHALVCSFSPYHLESIWKQNVPTMVGGIGLVKTDRRTHEFISLLTDIKGKSIMPDKPPYLGFYDVPGIALIIDSIPVFSPWLTYQKQSEVMLSRVSPGLLHSAIIGILLKSDGTMPSLPQQFANFPNGYTKVGEATCTYGNQIIQLWLPTTQGAGSRIP